MMEKSELRKLIRSRKRQFTSEQLSELSLAVVGKLERHPLLRRAHVVLLYAALPDEVDTNGLIERLPDKTVLLPKVTGEGSMELRRYTGSHDWDVGTYGIKEPTGSVFADYGKIDLAIVPGMAFDVRGHRLGRGKGFYDRFLAQIPSLYKIGICFPFQLLDDIPVEDTDVSMDEIIF